MNTATLSSLILALESGRRPAGGIRDSGGEIFSLGAEHLDGQGGFDLSNIKRISREFYKSMSSGRVSRNDILLVKDGATTGKVSFVGDDFPFGEAAVNEHVFRLSVSTEVACPTYIFRYLQSPIGKAAILRDFRGATVGGISRDFVSRVRLPLPPLDEQRRIAALLDKADAVRRKGQDEICLAEDLAHSAFLEVFGKLRSHTERAGCGRLGNYLKFLTSGSRGWAKYYSDTGTPFLRIQNVGANRLLLTDLAHVNPPEDAEAERTTVRPGDVLMSITADLGRTAVIPEGFGPAHINQHLALLRVEGIDPVYLSTFLASTGGRAQVARLNRGGVKAGLNFDDIRSIEIPLPPMEEQRRFRTIWDREEALRANLERAVAEATTLFDSASRSAFGALRLPETGLSSEASGTARP